MELKFGLPWLPVGAQDYDLWCLHNKLPALGLIDFGEALYIFRLSLITKAQTLWSYVPIEIDELASTKPLQTDDFDEMTVRSHILFDEKPGVAAIFEDLQVEQIVEVEKFDF